MLCLAHRTDNGTTCRFAHNSESSLGPSPLSTWLDVRRLGRAAKRPPLNEGRLHICHKACHVSPSRAHRSLREPIRKQGKVTAIALRLGWTNPCRVPEGTPCPCSPRGYPMVFVYSVEVPAELSTLILFQDVSYTGQSRCRAQVLGTSVS